MIEMSVIIFRHLKLHLEFYLLQLCCIQINVTNIISRMKSWEEHCASMNF